MITETTSQVGTEIAQKPIVGRERDYSSLLWKQPHLLDLSYAELEVKNLGVKAERLSGRTSDEMQEDLLNYLSGEDGIKAVTVCFSNMEGMLHTLDYDKKFLINAVDNLTFDGSSIKGFTAQVESDLRIKLDWTSFRWLPSDLFGCGKVMLFANVCDKEGNFYAGDFRSVLSHYCQKLRKDKGISVNVAPEVEGFLFKGLKAEQRFDEKVGFELATMSGYFSSLPQDTLRMFIDKFAEVKRSLGFENEKDHPEVAPAQFELNYRYSAALDSADQILLYKLLARQVATFMDLTASFLPKPIQSLNGSGMHMNISLNKNDINLFYDSSSENNLSEIADRFVVGVLHNANDLCLVMNASVNSYRRLDPHYEAPNEIKVSSVDRGAMIRIPIGNKNSARIEVRTVAPDANPYLCIYAIIKAGMAALEADDNEYDEMKDNISGEVKKLPANIYEALDLFKESSFMAEIMGASRDKYYNLKMAAAERSPKALGSRVKAGEILYHHEVSNQLIWSDY